MLQVNWDLLGFHPALVLLGLVLTIPVKTMLADGAVAAGTFRPADPLSAAAVEHFYNLDHDAAVQDFEKILARHPNDPFALNHLLSAILVRELYRMGAINTGEYSSDSFIGLAHRPAEKR